MIDRGTSPSVLIGQRRAATRLAFYLEIAERIDVPCRP
jgi:hypothetical protein